MTYEQQRAQLVSQAQEHIKNGNIEEANKIMNQIRSLDAEHEQSATAQANLDALNGTRQSAQVPAQFLNAQGATLTDDGALEPDDMFASLEYRKAFMNYIVKGTPIPDKFTNTAYVTTSSTAGTIVPTTLYQQIAVELSDYGEIYGRVFKTFYPNALVIPTLSVKPTASWVDEDAGAESQKFTTDKISFSGYKLECTTAFSLFMTVASLDMFESQFVTLIIEAMVKAIEDKILNGNGSGCPKGILTYTPPTGQAIDIAAASGLSYELLCQIEGALPAPYRRAEWIMTKKSFMAWMGITDDNGQPIARINAGLSNGPDFVLNGRRVVLADGYMDDYAATVSADTICFALFDFSYYVFNEMLALMIKRFTDDKTDNTYIKAVMLADGKAIDTHSLVTVTKKAT